MSYFTAVVSRREDSWRSHDLAVDDFSDLGELRWAVRGIAWNPHESLVVLEHVGHWFAVINTSGDMPLAFVSDVVAAAQGPYAELLSVATPAAYASHPVPAAPLNTLLVSPNDRGTTSETVITADLAVEPVVAHHVDVAQQIDVRDPRWGGDLAALESFGIAARTVQAVLALHAGHPGRMVTEIYELLGLSEIADGVR